MARRSAFRGALAILVLLASRSAGAAPVLTGNVATDFNPLTDKNVNVIPVSSSPVQVAPTSWMAANNWVSGWNIKDIRTEYDPTTDKLYVGINFFGIAGDAYGSGNPGSQDTSHGGIDLPNLGGDKSITVAFAPDGPNGAASPGTPVIVAGVPSDKSQAGPGKDGFTVAQYQLPAGVSPGNDPGINHDYGQTLTDHIGGLAFSPSAQTPGFEFAISNFSKIAGLGGSKGLWLSAYAGSLTDLVGESYVSFTRLPSPLAQQIPEPSTMLAWSLGLAGAAAWRLRVRRRTAA